MTITHLVIIAVSLHLISILMFQLLHSKVTTKSIQGYSHWYGYTINSEYYNY